VEPGGCCEPTALDAASAERSAIPALRRRRLLAAYVALLPENRTHGGHRRVGCTVS
jgi:hypothetical protein